MSQPLSVCVLVCDEADALEACLAGVVWADEIVVMVDAKSSDASEDVARRLASRVEVRPYSGDVAQKRACAALARHDWILILDPDERVTPALADSIRGVLAGASGQDGDARSASRGPDAYRLDRLTFHLGRWIRHGDFYPDRTLRLFRRSRARWVGRDPHGRVEVDGEVADLPGTLLHYSYADLADQIRRIQFFSDQAADAMVGEGIPFRLHRLVLHPPARFLRTYLMRRGFLDGLPGLIIAGASAFYVFLKYAKHWERGGRRQDGSPPA